MFIHGNVAHLFLGAISQSYCNEFGLLLEDSLFCTLKFMELQNNWKIIIRRTIKTIMASIY